VSVNDRLVKSASEWFIRAAPAGTAMEIIEQIAQVTRMAVAEPGYRQMLICRGNGSPCQSKS
jgi:hypothetical protein